jgi:hypothetical protein
LKQRTVSGVPTLVLRGTHGGTFAIAREWTDHAEPMPAGEGTLISPGLLPALMELVASLQASAAGKAEQKHPYKAD